MLAFALEDRFDSTYDAGADITLEKVTSTVANAERFVSKVRSVLNM